MDLLGASGAAESGKIQAAGAEKAGTLYSERDSAGEESDFDG